MKHELALKHLLLRVIRTLHGDNMPEDRDLARSLSTLSVEYLRDTKQFKVTCLVDGKEAHVHAAYDLFSFYETGAPFDPAEKNEQAAKALLSQLFGLRLEKSTKPQPSLQTSAAMARAKVFAAALRRDRLFFAILFLFVGCFLFARSLAITEPVLLFELFFLLLLLLEKRIDFFIDRRPLFATLGCAMFGVAMACAFPNLPASAYHQRAFVFIACGAAAAVALRHFVFATKKSLAARMIAISIGSFVATIACLKGSISSIDAMIYSTMVCLTLMRDTSR